MASTDAKPVPRKNTALRIYMEFRDNTGALIAGGVTGADSERSLDGAAFADCTNEFTEIGTSGMGYLELTAAEMNTDATTIKSTCTNANSKPFTAYIYPEEVGDIRVNVTAWNNVDLVADGENFWVDEQGTAQSLTTNVLRMRAAAAIGNNAINGSIVRLRGTTAANYWQYFYVVSSSGDDLTLNAAPTITPTGTITYQVLGQPASNLDTPIATLAKIDTMLQLNGGGPNYQYTAGALANGVAGTDFDLIHIGTASAGSANTIGSTDLGVTLTEYLGKFIEITSGTTATVHHRGFITAQSLGASPPNITFFPPLASGSVANGNTFKIKKYNPVQLAGITHTSAVVPTVSTLTGHTPQSGDCFPTVTSILGFVDTEIAALAAAIVTLTGYVDTEVAAIKAKTDQLTFSQATRVDVNVRMVNSTLVQGSGTTLDPWRPV